MIERFRARAAAVRSRGIPPIEGADRQRYIEQAKLDFMDYAMLGDAEASLEDGRAHLEGRPETQVGHGRGLGQSDLELQKDPGQPP